MAVLRTLAAGVVAAAAMTCGVANAAIVSLENITAEWFGAVPVSGSTTITYGAPGVSTDARWGTAISGNQRSGYDFDATASSLSFVVPPSPSPTQVIGTFNHVNFPISSGTSISSINLRITANITVDDGASEVSVGQRTFLYAFDHWETPNADNPCADGGPNNTGVNSNGCADRVIANWLASSEDFVIGSDIYTLNILGFSLNPNGSNSFSQFWTAEGQNNVAYLVGNVALRSSLQVPEPGTLALLGLGLMGIGVARRRRLS